MGSKIIKLWLSDQSMRVNPYNTDWSKYRIENCIDVLETDYYKKTLGKEFSVFILETHTFDTHKHDANVVWWDGLDDVEYARVEQEMYEVASYLMRTYNGTGKKFILQNWEGDNMLVSNGWRYDDETGFFYQPGRTPSETDDMIFRVRENGLLRWFLARQSGVDKARKEFSGKTDVDVKHALEFNFTCLSSKEAPYPYIDSPLVLQRILPYTDCDLYSYSCWSASVLSSAWTIRDRLEQIADAIGETYIDIDTQEVRSRRPLRNQKSRVMLGEFGGPERYQATDDGSWAQELTDEIARRQRKMVQIQVENALDFGVDNMVFWEIYCNVPRVDTVSPVSINTSNGEMAFTNDLMQGSWLIRADGSYTDVYMYFNGLLDDNALLFSGKYKEGRTVVFDAPSEGFELRVKAEGLEPYLSQEVASSIASGFYAEASYDGLNFKKIGTDCFVTVKKGDVCDLVVINSDRIDCNARYIRINFDKIKYAKPKLKIYSVKKDNIKRK